MAKPNINQIMAQWKGGKTAVKAKAAMPVAKPKATRGVPGMMATRNNLGNMRKDTMPKGCK